MSQRPLFIPLRTEYFEAFRDRTKHFEYRPYGARWNERTCTIGRRVTISKGYGKQHRLHGRIAFFFKSPSPPLTANWRACYGDRGGLAACIFIQLDYP